MGSYGRNFEFRVPPESEQRKGRFAAPATGVIPIGAAVIGDTGAGFNDLGLQIVKLCSAGDAPKQGFSGLAVYEYGPAAFAGNDPFLTTYADKDAVVPGKALQVVSGHDVKVVFTNTHTRVFLGNRTYAGRVMVNGLGATATVTVGDYLIPGDGDDVNGYWASTASATNAWFVITGVDSARGEVEAQMQF